MNNYTQLYPQNEPYRVGIVGAGRIARAHGAACEQLTNVKLCAICDISEQNLNRYGDEFGISQRYQTVADMLANEPLDIVIICNWGVDHAKTGIEIAQSGKVKAILCEKPFTMNAAEAQQLVAAAQAHGVLITEAFKFRHHPMHITAKQLVDQGAIGDLLTIRSTFLTHSTFFTGGQSNRPETRNPAVNWRFNKAKGGGSVYDVASYCIHHARFMVGAEPVRVYAVSQSGIEVDEAAYILLEFPTGQTAQISVGFNGLNGEYVEICGAQGMLRMNEAWNNENSPVQLDYSTKAQTTVIPFEATSQFVNQLQHLCDCLATGQVHRISQDNCIQQMKVIDAVFQSIATRQVVNL